MCFVPVPSHRMQAFSLVQHFTVPDVIWHLWNLWDLPFNIKRVFAQHKLVKHVLTAGRRL